MDDYKIQLGVDVDVSDIQTQINNKAKDVSVPVKLEIENISDIKKQIQNLGVLKDGIEIPLTIDTNVAIKSAQQVGQKIGKTTAKEVKQSFNLNGVIDKEILSLMKEYNISGGKKSKAFKEIKQAYVNYRDTLSGKNSSVNSDDVLGSFSSVSGLRQVADAIDNHVRKNVDGARKSYKSLREEVAKTNNSLAKISLPEELKSLWGDQANLKKKRLGTAFTFEQGHESLEKYVNELNSLENVAIKIEASTATDMANELYEKLEIAKGRMPLPTSETYQRTQSDIEEVERSIIASFDNVEKAERQASQSSIDAANTVAQAEEKKRQEYEKTLAEKKQRIKDIDEEVNNRSIDMNDPDGLDDDNIQGYKSAISILRQEQRELLAETKELESALKTLETPDVGKTDAGLENVESDLKQVTVTAGSTSDAIKQMTDTMSRMKFDHSSIDAVAKDLEGLGVEISKISVKDNGANLDVTVKGVDTVGRAVTEIRRLDKATGEISPISKTFTQSFETSAEAVKRLEKETAQSFKRLKSLAKEMGDIDIKIANLEASGDIDGANSLKRVLNDLESEYKELYSTAKQNLSADQFRELDQIFSNTTGAVRELNNEMARSAEASELTTGLERLKTIAKEINGLKLDIFKFEDADNIERASNQLNELENEAAELRATLQQKFNVTSFDEIDNIARQGEEALNSLIAKAEEAKAKLAKSIKMDIESGNFENQFDTMLSKFDSLSDANDELRRSYDATKDAYQAMLKAADADTGDEIADRQKLIQAEKRYAEALEKTNNLIKIQARADKIDADNQRLVDDRAIYQAKIDNWLTKNSAATERFGAKLMELRAKAETADRVELNHLEKELTKVDKAADKAGLKMMSLGDRIKSKIKEYSAYLGVAEVFMWAEQGMREMFNTVLEIDTAMTGLYRVTDLTSSQYDALFNNMIDSAKEYGATLNDIINATSDWVRAGFDANTALGLAEVTTMYQHISDLDYDTAAENLITAYNGFKDELNTAFSGDEVAAVEYIADIFNELDNNFAVTSAGLGEALTRSASALDLAGNTIQETAG